MYGWGEARVSPMLHNQLAMPDNSKMQVSGYCLPKDVK